MSASKKYLTLQRPMVMLDHQRLRGHMDESNHKLPDLQIKWRRLGETGITLVAHWQYGLLTELPGSRLRGKDTTTLADRLNKSTIPKMAMAGEVLSLTSPVADFEGLGRFVQIGYRFQSRQLAAEYQHLTNILDATNGQEAEWGEFKAFAPVASVDSLNAEQRVLDLFQQFAPDVLRFQKVTVAAS